MPQPRPGPVGGFFYPLRGLRFLLRHPRLATYVAIPVAINTVLFSVFAWFAGSRFGRWLDAIVPQGEGWFWSVLYYLLGALFAVLLFLVIVYAFTLVGNLILAPFNDLLSEKVEWIYTGNRLEEPFRLGPFVKDLARSFRAELGRMLFYGIGLLTILSLNLFPPIGTALYTVVMPVFTFFFLGWEYMDYPMERWHLPFSAKRAVVLRNGPTLVSFGAGAALLLIVPLLNLLAIPVCVAGGTLLFCDLRAAARLPAEALARASGPAPPAAHRSDP